MVPVLTLNKFKKILPLIPKENTSHSPNWPIYTMILFKQASSCKTLKKCKIIISDHCHSFTQGKQFLLFLKIALFLQTLLSWGFNPIIHSRELCHFTPNTLIQFPKQSICFPTIFSLGHVSSVPQLILCLSFLELHFLFSMISGKTQDWEGGYEWLGQEELEACLLRVTEAAVTDRNSHSSCSLNVSSEVSAPYYYVPASPL